MLIYLLKFTHILLIIILLSTTTYCLILAGSGKFLTTTCARRHITHLNKTLLLLATFSMLTGTLLVYPKHFTFSTAWIQAAYILLAGFCLGLLLLILSKKTRVSRLSGGLTYLVLIMILISITHDAVTKTTFLFKENNDVHSVQNMLNFHPVVSSPI